MTNTFKRGAAMLAAAASVSMMATPALANHRWGGGYGGYGGYHRDRGVDAGDVLAGVLIIGGIAAIASAASKASKEKKANPEYRYPDGDYRSGDDRNGSYGNEARPEWRGDDGARGSGAQIGINEAVDRCLDEVSRGSDRARDVDSVNRDGNGWRIAGRTDAGSSFACTVDGDGRIRNVNVDGGAI